MTKDEPQASLLPAPTDPPFEWPDGKSHYISEEEWLQGTQPSTLIWHLWPTGSKRKFRLFAIHLCQRLFPLFSDERFHANVLVAEQFIDGATSLEQLLRSEAVCNAVTMPVIGVAPEWEFLAALVMKMLPSCCRIDDPAAAILDVLSPIDMAVAGSHAKINSEEWLRASGQEGMGQCNVLRDIFGPLPFRPITLDASLLSDCVTKLASAIYQERAWDRLPILADALEEVGCTDQEILSHLRSEGPHVRGCWAVDLLLGKQ